MSFQEALDVAAEYRNWDIVEILLGKFYGLDANQLFYAAATCSQEQDDMIERAWEYANESITQETRDMSLYGASYEAKTETVALLLSTYGASAKT